MENTVKWNTMDSVPEESGKQYLVAHCYDNGSKTIDIATYYHEGDTAKLLLRNPKKCDKTGMDKLLNDIFPPKKKIKIEEDGFYIRTTEHIEDTDCMETLIRVLPDEKGFTPYWAELPFPQ